MSFRRYGGVNYNAKNNIVKSNYNTAANLFVTREVGQYNSYINFLSDISGNIIYGDLDIYGNLDVSNNAYIFRNLDVSGNENLGGNLLVYGSSEFKGPISAPSGVTGATGSFNNVFVYDNMDVSGNLYSSFMYLTATNQNYSIYPNNSVVPKSYVDTIGSGLRPSETSVCATTASIGGAGDVVPSGIPPPEDTDGYQVQEGDYVLVICQNAGNDDNLPAPAPSSAVNNGAWIVSTGAWSRPTLGTFSAGTDAAGGFSYIQNGTAYENYALVQINEPAMVGTEPLQFTILYQVKFEIGQGLNVEDNLLSVNPTLNFINYLDSTPGEPNASGSLRLGTNSSNVIIGPTGPTSYPIIMQAGVTGPAASFSKLVSNNDTYLAITNNNNVGIGTTSPAYKLDVNGNINFDGNLFQNGSIFSTSQWITSNSNIYYNLGNVGIGTSTPTTKLDVRGAIVTRNSADSVFAGLTTGNGSFLTIESYNSGNTAKFPVCLVPYGGNVGIGTTAPAFTLDVTGTFRTTGALELARNPSSSNVFIEMNSRFIDFHTGTNVIDFDSRIIASGGTGTSGGGNIEIFATNTGMYGNVGIGTTAPTAPLHVVARGNAGPTVNGIYVYNETASANQNAIVSVRTNGASSGNPFVSYDITGVTGWSTGIDNADADKFKISGSWDNLAANTRMTFDNAGNVGIGTTAPAFTLDVNGSTRISGSTTLGNNLVFSPIGTNASRQISFSGETDGAFIRYAVAGIDGGSLEIGTTDNQTEPINFTTSGTNRMTINNTGVGIGTTAPGFTLDVNGNIRGTGDIRATSFTSTSDYRLKSNIQPISKSIDNLKPVEYDLSGNKHNMGFIAHEVQEEFPFLVEGEKDGENMQSINYDGFIALLVKEVQDLKKENEILKDRLDTLENIIIE